MPGPLAPPGLILPSLKMTALSYSCTTLMQRKREMGRVIITTSKDNKDNSREQQPGPVLSAAQEKIDFLLNRFRLYEIGFYLPLMYL